MSDGRTINSPQPGFWLVRAWSRGPKVPARIWRVCQCTINGPAQHAWQDTCDRYPPLIAERNGERCDPLDVWHWGGTEITEDEYWRRMFRDDAPVDLKQSPPAF